MQKKSWQCRVPYGGVSLIIEEEVDFQQKESHYLKGGLL